jgi:hypothetical protein
MIRGDRPAFEYDWMKELRVDPSIGMSAREAIGERWR